MDNLEEAATAKPKLQASRKKRVIRNYPRRMALRKLYLDMTYQQRAVFVEAAKTSEGYIHQIYGGWCLCSVYVAQRIEAASNGKIPAWYLRTDIFAKPADAPNLR